MLSKVVFLITFLLVVVSVNTMVPKNVAQHFESEDIVPESLDKAPVAQITVIYPNNKEVQFNELTPSDVKSQPQVTWNADPNRLYTLSMIDLDAPSRAAPVFRELNHWLVVNIKGNYLSTGQTLTPYTGSGPPRGSGLHRYVFLIFQQENAITVTPNLLKTGRIKFSIRQFARNYNLGNAVAGNFFEAQWDASVPEKRYYVIAEYLSRKFPARKTNRK